MQSTSICATTQDTATTDGETTVRYTVHIDHDNDDDKDETTTMTVAAGGGGVKR